MTPQVLLVDSPLTGLDVRHTFWWLRLLNELSRGHALLDGKPLTIIATADDLRPWRYHANRVACLRQKELVVLGDWAAVEASTEPVVQELLRPEPAPAAKSEAKV
jgi:ABC-type transporter Mla maintaining outer membrane lipid asymmetry ATPase subunit MlaF